MRCFSRVIRFVYESMIISTARRLSGVTRPVSSSTVRRSTSMVIPVISTEVSLLRFGASSGSRKLASSKVTTITPPAMKISSSRMGNHAPPVMVYGIVNINDRVMVPFGPAERHDRGRTPTLRRHLASLAGDGISRET